MKERKTLSLSYNAVFKALVSNNKYLLSKIIQSAFDYFGMNININNKELFIRNNELILDSYKDKQYICDYIISIDDNLDVNIELNKYRYSGLIQRNIGYGFKIYVDHFKKSSSYDKFSKYSVLQINFNKFANKNNKRINKFVLLDMEDNDNILSESMKIINIDIESCYGFVYNNTNKEEICDLERFGALLNCESLKSVSNVLGDDLFTMEEKEKLLDDVNKVTSDNNINEAVKFEDSIDYRFEAMRETGYEEGVEQGIEQTQKDNIINMIKENIEFSLISKITGKDIDYITNLSKEIQ